MRKTIENDPKHGKQRIKKDFLWFPKTLRLPLPDNRMERRWLETVEWVQEWDNGSWSMDSPGWRDKDWAE